MNKKNGFYFWKDNWSDFFFLRKRRPFASYSGSFISCTGWCGKDSYWQLRLVGRGEMIGLDQFKTTYNLNRNNNHFWRIIIALGWDKFIGTKYKGGILTIHWNFLSNILGFLVVILSFILAKWQKILLLQVLLHSYPERFRYRLSWTISVYVVDSSQKWFGGI